MSTTHTPRRIIVGVDGSQNAKKAADWAIQNAYRGDTVVLVHAWHPVIPPAEFAMPAVFDDSYAKKVLDQEVERVTPTAKAAGILVQSSFISDDPRHALTSQPGDLRVVGARGHTGLMGLVLGSVADYVVRHSTIPVVVIPGATKAH